MKKIIGYMLLAGLLAGGLLLLVKVGTVTPNGVILHDGFGRVLTAPPIWARIFLTPDQVWAGALWHLFDIVWFFGGAFLAYILLDQASAEESSVT